MNIYEIYYLIAEYLYQRELYMNRSIKYQI